MAVSLRVDDPEPRLHILSVLDSPDLLVGPQSRFQLLVPAERL